MFPTGACFNWPSLKLVLGQMLYFALERRNIRYKGLSKCYAIGWQWVLYSKFSPCNFNKAGPTPSAYSAHVFLGKHVNTPSRIFVQTGVGSSTPLLTPLKLFVFNEIYMVGNSI